MIYFVVTGFDNNRRSVKVLRRLLPTTRVPNNNFFRMFFSQTRGHTAPPPSPLELFAGNIRVALTCTSRISPAPARAFSPTPSPPPPKLSPRRCRFRLRTAAASWRRVSRERARARTHCRTRTHASRHRSAQTSPRRTPASTHRVHCRLPLPPTTTSDASYLSRDTPRFPGISSSCFL